MFVSELIPKKLGLYFLLFLLGIGMVAALEYSHLMMPVWARFLAVPSIAAIDFNLPGNLSTWFSSNLWTFCGLVCLAAFLIGRFEERDRNRSGDIWLWGAIASFFLSVDSVCQIRVLLRDVLVKTSGTAIYGDGEIWWVGLYVIFFGMIGSRLLVEMRHYLPSCNAFFFAGMCHILAICVGLRVLEMPHGPQYDLMIQTGLEMLGNVFALLAFSLYLRRIAILAKTNRLAAVIAAENETIEIPEEEPTPTPAPKTRASRTKSVQIVHPAHKAERVEKTVEVWGEEEAEEEGEYEDEEDEEEDYYYDDDDDDDDDDEEDDRPRKRRHKKKKRPKKRRRSSVEYY